MAEPGRMQLRLVPLVLGAVAIVVASSFLGYTPLDWNEVFHPAGHTDAQVTNVYWQWRVPRTLLAATAGAGLAIAGVILQALLRNPLATPYTLGIASGASLAAAFGFLLNIGGYWLGLPVLSVLAFGGACCALSLVYAMARLRAGRDMTRLLLAGVCVSYLCSAGVLLITVLAGKAVTNTIVVWMVGSLAMIRPQAARDVAVILLPTLAIALYVHRHLDLIAMGDELAASRGVAVDRTIWLCFALVGLLTAVIVANCGPIGFIGLMVPHIARTLLGHRTLPLLIGAALLGAAFLATCDALARSFSAYELPVGVLTNMLGAVFFFYLLATRDVAYAGGR